MRTYDEWLQNQGQTTFIPIDPSDMPQDPGHQAEGWSFKILEHGGREPDAMPQWIEATDAEGRSAIYEALQPDNPAERPQDDGGSGLGWSYKLANHDARDVPLTITALDTASRAAIYSPLRDQGVIGRWELVVPPQI